MDIIKAKKLFAPPEKPDSTKLHLILKVNQGFEALAMELCDLIPKSEKLDAFVQELHKVRLQVVFDIEHVKTGKKIEETPVIPAKKPKGGKVVRVTEPPPEPPADLTIADSNDTNDEIDNEEEDEEGFI